jgi:hypothetical protein
MNDNFVNYLRCRLGLSCVAVTLMLVSVFTARAEWCLLPPLKSGPIGWWPYMMVNRNGRLVTTELHRDEFLKRYFVVYDIPTRRRLFDRYWTQASNEEQPFSRVLIDTNNNVTLAFDTEMQPILRRYSPQGVLQSELVRHSGDSIPSLLYSEWSLWGPGYIYSSWKDDYVNQAYVQTSSMDLHVLRTDTFSYWEPGTELEGDGAGGYYLILRVQNQELSRNLCHMSATGVLQGPVMFDLHNGFGCGDLCYAPGSRTLMALSGDMMDENHEILYCLRFDPDNLQLLSQELISTFINTGSIRAAQDTIWYVREVTPPVPPSPVYQGVAIWAYTQQSGWFASDSIPPSVWPLGNSIIYDFDFSVYPYFVIAWEQDILVRYTGL